MATNPLDDRPNQKLICVDGSGNPTGNIIDRKSAHTTPGTKHLAIQVLVFDNNGNIILHERPARKVGGNTLDAPTTHVLEGETPEGAAIRCVMDEYGISDAKIKVLSGVAYENDYKDGSCENEYVLAAYMVYNGPMIKGTKEAPVIHYIKPKDLLEELESKPQKYAVWLKFAVTIVKKDPSGRSLFE